MHQHAEEKENPPASFVEISHKEHECGRAVPTWSFSISPMAALWCRDFLMGMCQRGVRGGKKCPSD